MSLDSVMIAAVKHPRCRPKGSTNMKTSDTSTSRPTGLIEQPNSPNLEGSNEVEYSWQWRQLEAKEEMDRSTTREWEDSRIREIRCRHLLRNVSMLEGHRELHVVPREFLEVAAK